MNHFLQRAEPSRARKLRANFPALDARARSRPETAEGLTLLGNQHLTRQRLLARTPDATHAVHKTWGQKTKKKHLRAYVTDELTFYAHKSCMRQCTNREEDF